MGGSQKYLALDHMHGQLLGVFGAGEVEGLESRADDSALLGEGEWARGAETVVVRLHLHVGEPVPGGYAAVGARLYYFSEVHYYSFR